MLGTVGAAAFLRLHDLSSFPSGLHGDEAIVGLEAKRILAEGWIGPYSPFALGQPSGPLYLTAVSVGLLGDSVLAVRLVPAVLGTLTVLAFSLLLRRHLGSEVAVVGAALLAVMGWHVHFSRIGFPLAAWPLVVVLATGALLEALRSGRAGWWAAAGGTAALGVYAYHAHPPFLGILGLFLCSRVARGAVAGTLGTRRRGLVRLAAFGAAFGVVVLPMARFAADPANDYFDHAGQVSVFTGEPWAILDGMPARAAFLTERYVESWRRLCCEPRLDGVDATGVTPLVPAAMLLLAVVGLRFWRRSPLTSFGLLLLIVMPWAAAVTVDGAARRTFAMAPFVALFAGVGLVELRRAATRLRPALGVPLATAALLLGALAVFQNVANEFGTLRGSPEERWTFAREMTDAASFMRGLPADHRVYFFSDRWSVDYETRRFLAPGRSAEDRSAEFGELSSAIDPAAGRPVFVFLGAYRDLADVVRARHPGGETVVGGTAADPTFVAYLPPLAR